MKPLPEHFTGAVEELSAIPFFPQETGPRIAVSKSLARFVGSVEALRWLTDTALDRMTKWQGVAELRALYCVKYRPMDGQEGGTCSLPGFTPDDCEAEYQRLTAARQQRYLPAPDEPPLTEQEKQEIEALKAKVAQAAARMRIRPSQVRVQDWLVRL